MNYMIQFGRQPGNRLEALQKIFRQSVIGYDSGDENPATALRFVVTAKRPPDMTIAALFDATIETAPLPTMAGAVSTNTYLKG